VFWFGTDKGVSRYDGKTWKNFGKNEGLLDSHVYAVAITPNGDIWAGTKRGVVRIAEK
jgi:ligand-binding sensor domain-containing protein